MGYLNENVLPCGPIRGHTDLTFKCLYIVLAFSTCFLYLNENVLPCGLIRGDTDLTFICIGFNIYHSTFQQSRQSSCQSIKAFNRIYCTHLYLFTPLDAFALAAFTLLASMFSSAP